MKIACITGASSGIGSEFARQLAAKGYQLILIARRLDRLQQLNATLPVECELITCDLSSEEACRQLGERLCDRDLDLLINCAGFGSLGRFHESDLSRELEMIHVNVCAPQILTRLLLPGFIRRDRGCILNVASVAGLMKGGPYMSTYYATKAYITSMTSAIYEELRELHSHVRICMLCPGPVNTEFNQVANVEFSLKGISAADCVSYCLKKMKAGQLTIVPNFLIRASVQMQRLVSRKLILSITAKQQHKKGSL